MTNPSHQPERSDDQPQLDRENLPAPPDQQSSLPPRRHKRVGRQSPPRPNSGFHFQEVSKAIHETLPPEVRVRKIAAYKIPLDINFPRIVDVRAQIPRGVELNEWRRGIEKRFGIFVNLHSERISAGVNVQLRLAADPDGIIRSPSKIERLVDKLHGKFPIDAEAKSIERPGTPTPRNLKHVKFVSIDPEGSRDLDDIVWAKRLQNGNIRCRVAYTDVSAFIDRDSDVYDYARSAGRTVYGRDLIAPLVGAEVAFRQASLLQGETRRAWVSEFVLSPQGKILSEKFYRAHVRNHLQTEHAAATAILADATHPSQQVLRDLSTAAQLLRHGRDGKSGVLRVDNESGCSGIVPEFAVAAKEIAARYAVAQGLPVLFRVHGAPSAERIKDFVAMVQRVGIPAVETDFSDPKNFCALLQCLKDVKQDRVCDEILESYIGFARYDTLNDGHHGLKLPAYMTMSGLREFAALVNHLCFDAHLRGEAPPSATELRKLVADANRAERSYQEKVYKLLTLEHIHGQLQKIGTVSRGKLVQTESGDLAIRKRGNVYPLILSDEERQTLVPERQIAVTLEGYDLQTRRRIYRLAPH